MSRRTSKIHGPIFLHGATLQQARQAILLGMYYNKGLKLTYEGETASVCGARPESHCFASRFKTRAVACRPAVHRLRKPSSRARRCDAGYFPSAPNTFFARLPIAFAGFARMAFSSWLMIL